MARALAWVLAAVAALELGALQGCSLINLDALDPASDADGRGGTSDAWVGTTASVDATVEGAADDSSTENGDDTVGESGSHVTDAPQGGDVLDMVASSGEAESLSGSASGTASGSTSGSTSGTVGGSGTSATVSGTASGSASGTGGGSDAGDNHKCGSSVLKPQVVVASSFASPPALPGSCAIDGDFSTRWGSAAQTDPSWIYVDFGAPVFVNEVDILWQSACATAYDIQVSNDAMTWTTLRAVTGTPAVWQNPPTGWTMDDVQKGLSGKGRYLRMYGTARCLAMYGYSIWEIRAFGDTDASCTP
jgi:hypothetical protein